MANEDRFLRPILIVCAAGALVCAAFAIVAYRDAARSQEAYKDVKVPYGYVAVALGDDAKDDQLLDGPASPSAAARHYKRPVNQRVACLQRASASSIRFNLTQPDVDQLVHAPPALCMEVSVGVLPICNFQVTLTVSDSRAVRALLTEPESERMDLFSEECSAQSWTRLIDRKYTLARNAAMPAVVPDFTAGAGQPFEPRLERLMRQLTSLLGRQMDAFGLKTSIGAVRVPSLVTTGQLVPISI